MNTASSLALLLFITRFSAQKRDELLRFLPEDMRNNMQNIHPPHTAGLLSCEERLMNIHYSWVSPLLQNYAKEDKHYFASLFPKDKYEKIRQTLQLPKRQIPLTDIARTFLSQVLYTWFVHEQPGYIPVELLPKHPLATLLSLSKKELLLTFDYLGLHDLVIDLKRMVEAKKLQGLQQALTKEKRAYVQKLMKRGEPIQFKYLELEHWDGDRDHLNTLLHTRGINRVSKALYGCPESILWHVKHGLDVGRAKMIDTFLVNPKNQKVQDILLSQVLEAVEYVKTGSDVS